VLPALFKLNGEIGITMLYSRQERYKRLLEMAPVVRIYSVIFVIISLIGISPLPSNSYETAYILLIFSQLFLTLLALYIFIFGYENFRAKITKSNVTNPFYLDYITLIAVLL
jgi:hypothetical protein